MKRFCRDSPAERLGYQKDGIMDIKKHKWFQGFDWDGLLDRSLAPPLVPSVQSTSDASNFDQVGLDGDIFSCEGAAQQVHLCLCLPVCFKTEFLPVWLLMTACI